MLHQGDIVEEIETKRQGKVTEAPKILTDTRRWRVEFFDGKEPILRYFTESDIHLIRLIKCPHTKNEEPRFVRERTINETITMNDGKRVSVLYSSPSDGVVH